MTRMFTLIPGGQCVAFGNITVALRLIELAFLANPLEQKGLDRANRISPLQWGGRDCVMPNQHLK